MTYHFAQSVRGALRWNATEMKRATKSITRTDGTRFTPDQLRTAFEDLLADGNEVIPCGHCDNFDPKLGCRGHVDAGDMDRAEGPCKPY